MIEELCTELGKIYLELINDQEVKLHSSYITKGQFKYSIRCNWKIEKIRIEKKISLIKDKKPEYYVSCKRIKDTLLPGIETTLSQYWIIKEKDNSLIGKLCTTPSKIGEIGLPIDQKEKDTIETILSKEIENWVKEKLEL